MHDIRESDLLDRLRVRYPLPAWAFLPKVVDAVGHARRTLDAVAFSLWPSRGISLLGFEIKVHRSDWLKELRDPAKADFFAGQCHEFYVVAPSKAIVDPSEVPPDWGLLVLRGKRLFTVVKAKCKKKVPPPGWLFIASLIRGAHQELEERKHSYIHRDAVAAEVEKATKSIRENLEEDVQEAKELEESVRAFEKKSGVRIDDWNGAHMGEIVAEIEKLGVFNYHRAIERAAAILKREAQRLEEHLVKLKDSTSP